MNAMGRLAWRIKWTNNNDPYAGKLQTLQMYWGIMCPENKTKWISADTKKESDVEDVALFCSTMAMLVSDACEVQEISAVMDTGCKNPNKTYGKHKPDPVSFHKSKIPLKDAFGKYRLSVYSAVKNKMAESFANLTIQTTEEPSAGSCSFKLTEAELPGILFISTIANLVAVITLARLYRKLRSKNLYLLTILASNDLCSSVTILISNIVNTLTCDLFSRHPLCNILGWIGIGSFGWSMYIVATISVERYLMVVRPFLHRTAVTKLKLTIAVVIGAAVSLTFLLLPMVGVGSPYIFYRDNRFCGFNWAAAAHGIPVHTFFVEFLAIYGLAQVTITFFCNIATLLHMRCRKDQVAPIGQAASSHLRRRTSRFTLLTVAILTVNSICNGPFFIKLIIDGFKQKKRIEGVEDSVTSILLFCTPIINPILYLVFNKSYRQLLLGKKLCCKSTAVAPQRVSQTRPEGQRTGNGQQESAVGYM